MMRRSYETFHTNRISNSYWMQEINRVGRSRHNAFPSMSNSSNRCNIINMRHQPSSKQRAILIGIWRKYLCRSEEHTSELQSRFDLVCRLLLEKKKTRNKHHPI